MSDEDQQEIYTEFNDLTNMGPEELESWLESDESNSVGMTRDGQEEAIGHKSGRRIIKIMHTKKADLKDDDFQHMRKVNGYIKRRLAQRPSGDVEQTPWRYSLMNWGHDPVK